MNVHFIAIGGAAMHNLAIALHKKGVHVTGSDDEIFEPSRSRLEKYGLLPEEKGWDPGKITPGLDAVILGMHAREDNPELLKAQETGLKIYSYPEYLYEQTKDKKRIVIAGSHGKTTITSMVMHVMKTSGIKFDYMVGAQIEGFDTMVSLSKDAKFAVFEGDEYLSSPLDPRSKFLHYKPHIGLISGIAWDHINVFPVYKDYVSQFNKFANSLQPNGTLIYYEEDEELKKMLPGINCDINKKPYGTHPYRIEDGVTNLVTEKDEKISLKVFGKHNISNITGAKAVCNEIGISDNHFYQAISTFKGASKRLQVLKQEPSTLIFLDFAHSPSKLKATIEAVREQYPDRKLVAVFELHTFSSLNKHFLNEYRDTMNKADIAIVVFNPETIKHKKLEKIDEKEIKTAFQHKNLEVYIRREELLKFLTGRQWKNTNLLLMSSGNFMGIDFDKLTARVR